MLLEVLKTGISWIATSGITDLFVTGTQKLISDAGVEGKYKKASMLIGSGIFGMYVGDKLDDYIDKKVDDISNSAKRIHAAIKAYKGANADERE